MLEPVDDLVVDHVEAHRRQCHPRHYVQRAEPNRGVGVVVAPDIEAWYYVPEADRRQAHETEVKTVQEVPIF